MIKKRLFIIRVNSKGPVRTQGCSTSPAPTNQAVAKSG